MSDAGSCEADKAMAAPKLEGRRTVLKALSAGALGGALALSGRAGQEAGAQTPTPSRPGPGRELPVVISAEPVSPVTPAPTGQLTLWLLPHSPPPTCLRLGKGPPRTQSQRSRSTTSIRWPACSPRPGRNWWREGRRVEQQAPGSESS